MTDQEIHAKTCQLANRYGKHWQDQQKVRNFATTLTREDDSDVFAGLMPFFEESGYDGEGYWRQEVAGRLFAYRMPTPQKDLEEIIRISAPHYNLSIEQFPWYLALAFGRDDFRDQVTTFLDSRGLPERDSKTLETYLYWTGISDEKIREALAPPNQQRENKSDQTDRLPRQSQE